MNVEKKIILPTLALELIILVLVMVFGYYKLSEISAKFKEIEDNINKVIMSVNRIELKVDSANDSAKVITNENAKLKTTILAISKRIDNQEEMFRMLLSQIKENNPGINCEKILKKLDKEKKKMEKKLKKASRDEDDDDCTSII